MKELTCKLNKDEADLKKMRLFGKQIILTNKVKHSKGCCEPCYQSNVNEISRNSH